MKKHNYKEWDVHGIVTSFQQGIIPRFMNKRFIVRYTDGETGKSLSIADERSGVMFQIPFDAIYNDIMKGDEK